MNVVFVYADRPNEMNCSLWNCFFPTKAINKTRDNKATLFTIDEFIKNTEEVQKACQESDIIIIERDLFGDTLTMMQYWKVRNKNVAVIFDDAYHIIEPENVSYPFWHNSTVIEINPETKEKRTVNVVPKPLDQFKWGLRISKGAIMPTKVLAEDWQDYTYTYATHNYLDMDRYKDSEPLIKHSDIVLGWCGSMSHFSSFTRSEILPAINYVIKKYPNVKIMIGGDRRVFDRINVPESKKLFVPYVPEEQWASLVRSIDIGLAPMAGDYDQRRSWIKALEYMVLKVPWIASKSKTYEELEDYGKIINNSLNNWKDGLCEMIENLSEKKKFAETTAYEFALEQSQDKNVDKNLAIYQAIIDSDYQ